MSTATLPIHSPSPSASPSAAAAGWRPSPYLHVSDECVYNPHTDRTLRPGEPGYAALRRLLESAAPVPEPTPELRPLAAAGWLVAAAADLARSYHLKYVSLEAHTVCNQSCYFCPVSVAPRESHFMPTETYERIVRQIAELGEPIEAVFMISYNEPTLDARFVDQVRVIREAGLPPAT